ncbi:MAG: hypothetical protein MZU95_07075 [Desulfomicrobium escambiense]|nr:hypothetical protein [Desulfomicrobium escambiense]
MNNATANIIVRLVNPGSVNGPVAVQRRRPDELPGDLRAADRAGHAGRRRPAALRRQLLDGPLPGRRRRLRSPSSSSSRRPSRPLPSSGLIGTTTVIETQGQDRDLRPRPDRPPGHGDRLPDDLLRRLPGRRAPVKQ